MNRPLMEFWGRSLLSAFQGSNQTDVMTDWFQRAGQDLNRMNSNFLLMWRMPSIFSFQTAGHDYWLQAWELFFRMQQLSMQWMGMAAQKDCAAQSQKVSHLEEKVAEQSRTIEKLNNLINTSGAGNKELIHKFQGLIDQQSRQFQQLTASVGEYINNRETKKEGTA